MDGEEMEPTAEGWDFAVVMKGDIDKTVSTMPRIREEALDPVRHLVELRDRIRKKRSEMDCVCETTIWMKEDGRPMSYDMIRKVHVERMAAAGIRDTQKQQGDICEVGETKVRDSGDGVPGL
jgi:hypothetical protein